MMPIQATCMVFWDINGHEHFLKCSIPWDISQIVHLPGPPPPPPLAMGTF